MKFLPRPSFPTLCADKVRIFRESLSLFKVLSSVFFIVYAIACFTIFPKVLANFETNSTSELIATIVSQAELPPEIIEPTVPPTPTPTPIPSLVPVELIIPKLDLRTTVEHVGQTKTFNMDVPKNAAHVAWYVYGAKPGEPGNAVINGHYDTPTGAPAVFFKLQLLEVGDEIQTISEDGIEKTFVVLSKERHNYSKFPTEYVFHTKEGKNLNIITCDGIWDKKNSIYNDRLVIYATLKEG